MNNKDPITIERVANGYLIRPSFKEGSMYAMLQMYVFNDLASLYEWMNEHFKGGGE